MWILYHRVMGNRGCVLIISRQICLNRVHIPAIHVCVYTSLWWRWFNVIISGTDESGSILNHGKILQKWMWKILKEHWNWVELTLGGIELMDWRVRGIKESTEWKNLSFVTSPRYQIHIEFNNLQVILLKHFSLCLHSVLVYSHRLCLSGWTALCGPPNRSPEGTPV